MNNRCFLAASLCNPQIEVLFPRCCLNCEPCLSTHTHTHPGELHFFLSFSRKQIPQKSTLLHPIQEWLLWLKVQAYRGCEVVWLLAGVERLLTCVLGRMCVRSRAGSCFSNHSNWSLATAMTFNAKHRHNLSVLTTSLTHNFLVNTACIHMCELICALKAIHTHASKHTVI